MATILWSEAGRMRHYIEKSLAFGQKKSSNYAQRWANAVITIMWSRFDAEERKLFDAETDPERRAVINQRDALSTLTGRNEMRCAAAHVYTDDTIGLVVGFERFVRLITCWYQVESMLNIRMAEPLKYHAGTSVEWCGNRILATIGADVIPPAKQQRALAGLTKLQTNRMTVEEADSLTGLLVHLAPFARDPSIMYNLHAPACRVRSRGPRARVNLTADEQLACSRWRAALVNHPAIFAIVVCQELDYVPDYTASTAWEMSSDAAKAGAIVPAVAGHMHGVTWSLPLSPDDVSGPRQISIPVLEFLAIVGNFKTFGPLIPTGVTLRVTSDSITSVDVCAAASAHTPQMQHLHRALLDDLHFQRLSPNALIAHIFGETNVISDAKSRGYEDVVTALCVALRTTYTDIDPSPEVARLLEELRDLGSIPYDHDGPDPSGNGERIGEASHPGPPDQPRPFFLERPGPPARPRVRTRDARLQPWPVPSAAASRSGPAPVLLFDASGRTIGSRSTFTPPLPVLSQPPRRPTLLTPATDECMAAARSDSILARLHDDQSAYALRPADPALLDILVRDVLHAIDDQVPPATLKKDKAHWRHWTAFMSAMGTSRLRPNPADDPHYDVERESFLQAAFVVWVYPRLIPRRRSDPAAKPQSARDCLTTVRRIHARRGVELPPAPLVSKVFKGIVKRYVREHGVDALLPDRKSPLQNDHVNAIRAIPDGTVIQGLPYVVDWSHIRFICFAALVNTLRQMGSRKADLISPSPEEFDLSRVSRSNLKFVIGGVTHSDPSPELLRSMSEGDLVLLKPGATKADAVGVLFGDRPVPLPFHAHDTLSAAAAIVQLELAAPVRGLDRKSTPAFTDTLELTCMSHDTADKMFNALATHALGRDVAGSISLHSGRSWKATAIWELTKSIDTVKATCRWASEQSAKIYTRMSLEEHAKLIDRAMSVTITPALASECERVCPLDIDDAIASLSAQLDRLEGLRGAQHNSDRTDPKSDPPQTSRAFRADVHPSHVPDPDGVEPDDDDGLPIDERPLADTAALGPGSPVAVPFKHHIHGERYFIGHITKIPAPRSSLSALVGFEEVDAPPTTYQVDYDRLFVPDFPVA